MALTPVKIPKQFKKRLKKKPKDMRHAIAAAITQLRTDPRHNSLHTHRIWGKRGVYEARIDRSNRLTFHWDDDTIVLRNHCNHDILGNP